MEADRESPPHESLVFRGAHVRTSHAPQVHRRRFLTLLGVIGAAVGSPWAIGWASHYFDKYTGINPIEELSPPEPRREIVPKSDGPAYREDASWIVIPQTVLDTQKRPATFEFVMHTDGMSWDKKSSDTVVFHDQRYPATDVFSNFNTNISRKPLEEAISIIVIGLSSEDGDRREEEFRAVERAKSVATSISTTYPEKPIHIANFGQHLPYCHSHCTERELQRQRPFVVASVKEIHDYKNIESLFKEAVSHVFAKQIKSGTTDFPDIEKYSHYEIIDFK